MKCISTRLLKVESDNDYGGVFDKLEKLSLSPDTSKVFVVIDDYTLGFLLTIHVLKECSGVEDFLAVLGPRRLIHMILVLVRLKDIQNELKNYESKARIEGLSDSDYERYQELLSSRDDLLPELSGFWEEHPEIFDRTYQCILSFSYGMDELLRKILLSIDDYISEIGLLRQAIRRDYGIHGYDVLWSLDIVRESGRLGMEEFSIVEKFKILIRFLKRLGCRNIVIVDGSEYLILEKLLKLPGVSIA